MLCIQHFLKLSQLLVEFLGLVTLLLTFTRKAGGVVGIEILQLNLFARIYPISANVEIACHREVEVFVDEFLDVFRVVL